MQGNPAPNPVGDTAAVIPGGQVHHACAACNHQRKRCSESCELAPYLPITRKAEFTKLLRVFGVNSLTKLLKNAALKDNEVQGEGEARAILDPGRAHINRLLAIESLIWEAETRHHDPISGSLGELQRMHQENDELRQQNILLQGQIQLLLQQIQALQHQLALRHHDGCNTGTRNSNMHVQPLLRTNGVYQPYVEGQQHGGVGRDQHPGW